MKRPSTCGFTLIEILLVVAAIAILAGIVIIAINPNKQLGNTRNAQRHADVKAILDAVYQYSIDNGGLPANITETPTNICKSNQDSDCTGLIIISELMTDQKYLPSIPFDPSAIGTNDAGYAISKNANGRITVSAPYAEQDETISITR